MASVDTVLFLINEINKNYRTYRAIFAFIGIVYTGTLTLKLTKRIIEGFRVFVLARLIQKNLRHYGKWAVVTGGTDGIGKAYAHQLAKRGLSIVIIARNEEKLKQTAKELEETYGVEVSTIQADFSHGKEIYPKIEEQLIDKEIGILVNNVGTMYESPTKFLDVPKQKLWDLIYLNMASVTMLTYMIMPQMVQRKRGIVVNVSSISGYYPLPLMACYSASKVYVDWFSQALSQEYKKDGIIVQSLIPSYISTKLVGFSNLLQRPGFIVPRADTFASSAVATLGTTSRTTGFWSHGLQYFFFEHTPLWLWNITSVHLQKFLDSSKKSA